MEIASLIVQIAQKHKQIRGCIRPDHLTMAASWAPFCDFTGLY
jgi:hypothetical protein